MDNPEIVSKLPSARAVKSHTITKNFERLHSAKKAGEKSRLSLNELPRAKCQPQEKIRKKQDVHNENYKELQKADDALRQCLEVKRLFLSDIMKLMKSMHINQFIEFC